jgi:hypothetical protein
MNWLRRHPRFVTASLVVGFLLFRTALFTFTTAGEYFLYRDYGEAARNSSLAELYRNRNVEYPQLAVAFGSAAAAVADHLPDWTARLVSLRPNKAEERYLSLSEPERLATDRFEVAFGLLLFAIDLACLALVHAIACRAYPNEDRLTRQGRLAAYVLATGASGLILFDRQDLVVGLVALAALRALARGRPAVGYLILTLGTAYKLVPALLLPGWVLAAAAVRAAPRATPGHYLRCLAIEAAIAAVILAAWPILTYALGGGERGFVYLTFHSDRGLQLEAPVAWPVVFLDPSAKVQHAFGGYNLTGELADRIAKLTRSAMIVAVGLALLIAARGFWRYASGPNPPTPFPKREGGVIVPHVVASSLLVWLAFLLTGKVGSPQFMLWLGPLLPLLPLRAWPERAWAALVLLVMILTTLIFPCRYLPDVVGPVIAIDPYTRRGPNALGLFLLAAKSVTLAIATVWLAVSLARKPRVASPT